MHDVAASSFVSIKLHSDTQWNTSCLHNLCVSSRLSSLLLVVLGALGLVIPDRSIAVQCEVLSLLDGLFCLVLVLLLLLVVGLLLVLDLVLDKIVEGGDGADQTAEVDGHELVVGLDAHGTGELRVSSCLGTSEADGACGLGSGEVGKKVENVLEVPENCMVDRKFFVDNLVKVSADVLQAVMQALQRLQLRCHTSGQCTDGNVANITEQVLNSNLFCFFGFDS
jgi:hypothetical protein